jgi:hypothetical protein
VIISGAGYDHPAGFRHGLQPAGDVHPVAVDVIAFDDDIAEIHRNAKYEPLIGRHASIAFALGALRFDGTAKRMNDALELDEKAVTHGLHQPAAMSGESGLKDVAKILSEPGACASSSIPVWRL